MRLFFYFISRIYIIVLKFWTCLYKYKILSSFNSSVPIVSIGNIESGGTGKTPMTVFISKILTKKNISHIIITRGYKKMGTGTFVLDDSQDLVRSSPWIVGDEPYMMHKKLGTVPIIVDANKARAIVLGIKRFRPQLILLDDGFQSIKIKRSLDIVLINSLSRKSNFHLLPFGSLREPLAALTRAGFVIFTKYNLITNQKNYFQQKIQKQLLSKQQKYCFSELKSCVMQYNFNNQSLQKIQETNGPLSVLCVCGIADPKSFTPFINPPFKVKQVAIFKDHHSYQLEQASFLNLLRDALAKNMVGLVTTYKDFVKIIHLGPKFVRWCSENNFLLFVIDINVVLDAENERLVLQSIQSLLLLKG